MMSLVLLLKKPEELKALLFRHWISLIHRRFQEMSWSEESQSSTRVSRYRRPLTDANDRDRLSISGAKVE